MSDPSLERCANCGRVLSQCDCTEDDMNRWAAETIARWEGNDRPDLRLYEADWMDENEDDDDYL